MTNEQKAPYGFIYITTNNINGRKYIGQKKYDSNGRWKNYLGSGEALKLAIKKYGKENFTREILHTAYSAEELNNLEIEYIEKHNACSDDNFYNLVEGGGTVTGLKFSDDRIRKIRELNSGVNNYFMVNIISENQILFTGKNIPSKLEKK